MPSQYMTGQRIRRQTLRDCKCPECDEGRFILRADGTNECQDCGYELVTEWEWNRRQAEAEAK